MSGVEMLTKPERIRLVFELERADNPRLYDDLIRFTKGVKRVNRLRTLAHEGALAQSGMLGLPGNVVKAFSESKPADTGAAAIMNQVFDDPLLE